MFPRADSLDCYTYSPSGRRVDEDLSSSSGGGLTTPDDTSNYLFDFLFTVGPDIEKLEFLGVVAESRVKLLNVESVAPATDSAIVGNISKFAFEKSTADVLKLESLHAAHRYLRKDEVDVSEFFAFTVNIQSVRRSSLMGRGNSCFCFCLEGSELVPLPDHPGYTAIVPVRYVVVSERPFVDLFFQLLKNIKSDRLRCMKQYWTTGVMDRSSWFSHSARITSILRSLVMSPWCPPSSALHYDPIPISVSRPPVCGYEKIWEKSEFWIAWFTLGLAKDLSRSALYSLVAACLMEQKIMIISESQSRRANAVIGLLGFVSDALRWPHPVLASPPGDIAGELPNAPTPVIAALAPSRRYAKPESVSRRFSDVFKKRVSLDLRRIGNENCVFLNIDEYKKASIYWLTSSGCDSVVRSAIELEHVPVDPVRLSPERLSWMQTQAVQAGIDMGEVEELLQMVETVKAKIRFVVGDVSAAVRTKLDSASSFGDACTLAEREMEPSELRRGLVRSQAFELLLE